MTNRANKNAFRFAKYCSVALFSSMAAITLHAQAPAAPIIDNARVTVWDVTLNPGEATPMKHHDLDTVTMYLDGGKIRTTTDGKSKTTRYDFGDAVYTKAGVDQKIEDLDKTPARFFIVELKDHPQPPYPNTTGLPAAFPREGSKKTLENDRVVCWTYSWLPGVKTVVHFHDKDAIIGYRYTGSVTSTTPDGTPTKSDYVHGAIKFSPGNRSHYEELSGGQETGFMIELK